MFWYATGVLMSAMNQASSPAFGSAIATAGLMHERAYLAEVAPFSASRGASYLHSREMQNLEPPQMISTFEAIVDRLHTFNTPNRFP